MELLKNKILEEGTLIDNNILKVDSFLNHQMDINLFNEIGKEFKERFANKKVNKILTIESSGIGIACIVAQYFNVPVVYAKKYPSKTIGSDSYSSYVYSYTKQATYQIRVSKKFINDNDNILIIDDFLANGNAVEGLIEIIHQGGATLSGVGIVIEKGFQEGGSLLRSKNIQLESLAILDDFSDGKIKFLNI